MMVSAQPMMIAFRASSCRWVTEGTPEILSCSRRMWVATAGTDDWGRKRTVPLLGNPGNGAAGGGGKLDLELGRAELHGGGGILRSFGAASPSPSDFAGSLGSADDGGSAALAAASGGVV